MEASLREILPDGRSKAGVRSKAMMLGGAALVVSVLASAMVCMSLLPPTDGTELVAEGAESGVGVGLALRLAEGRVSDVERAEIAGGRVKLARKHLAEEGGGEHRALRLAEGRLSAAERQAEARGEVRLQRRHASAGGGRGEERALRLAEGGLSPGRVGNKAVPHRRGVSQHKAEAIAAGAFSGEQPHEIEEPSRRGVRQSEAVRLAEGRLSEGEREAIAEGTDVAATTDGVAASHDGVAASTAPKGGVKLSDLTVEERGRRVQRLLDVAAKIAAKKFKARPQQLAQDDGAMVAPEASKHRSRDSALAQRAEDKLVDRVDAESSGSIQEAGIEPKQWHSVERLVLQPQAASRHNVATAMKGIDSLALGAQKSMADVRVPLDQAVRRGWGGL